MLVRPTDDIFTSLLQPVYDSDSSKREESADSTISGDWMSVCISKFDSSTWACLCAVVFENKLVVCKKFKKSGAVYVTLFVSSEQADYRQVTIPKFHGPPMTEFVLSKPAESSLSIVSSSFCLQYRPLMKIILPSSFKPTALGALCECIEDELFDQIFRPGYALSDAAEVIVCGSNGHILGCNLRDEIGTSQSLKSASNQREFFKPLYSLDQPVVSVHTAAFPKRREQLDPLLYCGDDDSNLGGPDDTPNCLLFLGQRGKVALCYADAGTIGNTNPQKFAKFIGYNVPALILSSRLIPGQCLVYNSLRSLHRICMRQSCFKEIEERTPQLHLRCGPLLIPEASFKFPERVNVSVPPSILVDCELLVTGVAGQEATQEDVRLTLMTLKGDVRAMKCKVCGIENVSQDPDDVAREIKKCLNSIQTTSEQISSTSNAVSKVNTSLAELNQVLTLLCSIKCHSEGIPCVSGVNECPVECTVSGGFMELGVSKREMCIKVSFSYHGRKALGSGWSLLIQISPSSHNSHSDLLHSVLCCGSLKEGGVTESGSLTTPTTISRCVPLAGLSSSGMLEEKIPVSWNHGKPVSLAVLCYIYYDASNLVTTLPGVDSDHPLHDHNVSVLLTNTLVDAVDFVQPLMESPRVLHQPLKLATLCLDPKCSSLSSHIQQALLYSLQLPIESASFTPADYGTNHDIVPVHRRLLNLILPHIEGEVEDNFQHGSEIRLTSYDGSCVAFRLLRSLDDQQERPTLNSDDLKHSLIIKSSSRSQLAEIVGCVQRRLLQRGSVTSDSPPTSNVTTTKEELYKREAELRGISREATALLDQVAIFEKFSREPSTAEKAEIMSKTFSLYTRLRQLPLH